MSQDSDYGNDDDSEIEKLIQTERKMHKLSREVRALGEIDRIIVTGYEKYDWKIEFTIKGQEGKWNIKVNGGMDWDMDDFNPWGGWDQWKGGQITDLYKSPNPVSCECLAKDKVQDTLTPRENI